MMGIAPIGGIIAFLFYLVIPVAIVYFVIKLAIKNAIKELKQENIL